MGFIDRLFNRSAVQLVDLDQERREEEELRQMADECEMEYPRDKAKLLRVQRHVDSGGSFTVCKQMRSATGARLTRPVAHFPDFPLEADIEAEVSEAYGGGTYLVFAGKDRARVLKRVHVEGEDLTPDPSPRGRKPNLVQDFQRRREARLLDQLEEDPERLAAVDEKLLDSFIEKLTSSGKKSTGSPLQEFASYLESMEDIEERLSGRRKAGAAAVVSDISKAISDIAQNGPAALQKLGIVRVPGAGGQASQPALENPQPQPATPPRRTLTETATPTPSPREPRFLGVDRTGRDRYVQPQDAGGRIVPLSQAQNAGAPQAPPGTRRVQVGQDSQGTPIYAEVTETAPAPERRKPLQPEAQQPDQQPQGQQQEQIDLGPLLLQADFLELEAQTVNSDPEQCLSWMIGAHNGGDKLFSLLLVMLKDLHAGEFVRQVAGLTGHLTRPVVRQAVINAGREAHADAAERVVSWLGSEAGLSWLEEARDLLTEDPDDSDQSDHGDQGPGQEPPQEPTAAPDGPSPAQDYEQMRRERMSQDIDGVQRLGEPVAASSPSTNGSRRLTDTPANPLEPDSGLI